MVRTDVLPGVRSHKQGVLLLEPMPDITDGGASYEVKK
ncbi:Unknown protein sequence [Pseudomonas amygdali pv. lachrymans]|nr:Unknown protein sequence [Pseudomonas amygdali pv. lachrymans]